MKIAILGFGREGKSVLDFLKRAPEYKRADIFVLDKELIKIRSKGVTVISGKNYLSRLSEFDVVFRSPGVPYSSPEIVRACVRGTKFSSATALFFEYSPATIIGITGTKGKTTVSTLLFQILRAAKKDIYLAGNIGTPALALLPRLGKNSIVVLELSSFQLHDIKKSPHIAVVLEIFPDHQDAHLSLREYYEAKKPVAKFQSQNDLVFFFENDARSKRVAGCGHGKKVPVSESGFNIFNPDDLRVRGKHMFRNVIMTATVARRLGVPRKTILRVVRAYRGVEHRLEFVRTIRGVSFYNDSASTNPQSLAAAMRAFPNTPLVIIAGGKDKGLDYAPVAHAFRSKETKNIRGLVLIGENKNKIARAIKSAARAATIKIVPVQNLKAGIGTAKRLLSGESRGTIVLSPGAASFDMFANYAERGKEFKRLVR